MLPIQLRDIALFNCNFEYPVERPDDGETTAEEAPESAAEQPLRMAVSTTAGEGEFTCFIEGFLDQTHLPFRLSFEMGFNFGVPTDEPLPAIGEIQPTLVWIAFPHIREFIAHMSGRSPAEQYFLPPLTRLPQPELGSPEPGSDG